MWNPSVMILTASYGDGHRQVSKAIEQRLFLLGIRNVQIIDLMREAHPILNSISTKLYMKSSLGSQYGIDYYGWSYYITRDTRVNGSLGKYFNFLGRKKLKAIIEEARPDIILSTFPFGAAAEIGRELSIPTCTVITDYALHMRWTHPDTDRYYVATEELRAELLKKKAADAEQIRVTGIPIRPAFLELAGRNGKVPTQWNPAKRLVLISAGSYGVLHHIHVLVDGLLRKTDCEVVVVCGRNRRLEQKLRVQFEGRPDVHVFGYVDHIHELMAMSSCIVTKAGGVTLSEALALQLPVFIYKPFAGQEKENALYFASKGIARISQSSEELAAQLEQFLADPGLARMGRQRMAALHKGDATGLIVQDMMSMMARREQATV